MKLKLPALSWKIIVELLTGTGWATECKQILVAGKLDEEKRIKPGYDYPDPLSLKDPWCVVESEVEFTPGELAVIKVCVQHGVSKALVPANKFSAKLVQVLEI